jgi:hypothetical protein
VQLLVIAHTGATRALNRVLRPVESDKEQMAQAEHPAIKGTPVASASVAGSLSSLSAKTE